jgi:hypothetical protein
MRHERDGVDARLRRCRGEPALSAMLTVGRGRFVVVVERIGEAGNLAAADQVIVKRSMIAGRSLLRKMRTTYYYR